MPDSVFNALSPTADIITFGNLVNEQSEGASALRPDLFYTKQLLETIRLGADQYPYYRLAEAMPISGAAGKLQLRRWSPLKAHTVPLAEGLPPASDKGSVETYEIGTYQYGRYMEFTDKVDFEMIDPIISIYSKEYSIVAVETLDLLARDALLSVAQKFFANQKLNIEALTKDDAPNITDFRLIGLSLKKNLVKPRVNGHFQVIMAPEVTYDLISDPYVENYMRYNQTTKPMYDGCEIVPMFGFEFYESMATYNSGEFVDANGKKNLRVYRFNADTDAYEYAVLDEDTYFSSVDGYVNDSRTGKEASYLLGQHVWDIAAFNNAVVGSDADWYDSSDAAQKNGDKGDFKEFLVHHCLIVGKDALIRTSISGEDNAKMYVKGKGSAGVLDPIDQRQSIGFKINSVGFGSANNEAIVDYCCVPSTLNL